MAFSPKLLIASLIFILLVLTHVEAEQTMSSNTDSAETSLLRKMDCGAACAARCRLSSRPRLCRRACGTCCARCNCVPPGTSGNHEVCACYANLTTRGGRRKCP